MTRYLNPVGRKGLARRHHRAVSHILAPDDIHALCAYKPLPNWKSWPRVADGDWEIGDEPTCGYTCSNCRRAEYRMNLIAAPKPGKKTPREKLLERENARLRAWNEKAHEW